jgi:Protein of unknown function (DUF2971)
MPIPDDEKQRYMNFAIQLTRELESIKIPPGTLLWHYTNGSSLIAILDSMTIFSTHLSCLNDTTEWRYGSNLLQDAMAALRESRQHDDIALQFLDDAISSFKENPDFPAQAVVPHFVACFSEERDDLSQWRAYGGGENGYAIGFMAGDLWGCSTSMLARVNYDSVLHKELAKKAAERMVEFCREALNKYTPSDPVEFRKEFLVEWERAITMVAPLIKDPAFIKENECRIAKGFMPNDMDKLKFIQKGSMMSRHLPLQPPGRTPTSPYRLPISEIIVGPCRHPQISRTSVETLLRQKGYPRDLVTISKIPFQIT